MMLLKHQIQNSTENTQYNLFSISLHGENYNVGRFLTVMFKSSPCNTSKYFSSNKMTCIFFVLLIFVLVIILVGILYSVITKDLLSIYHTMCILKTVT